MRFRDRVIAAGDVLHVMHAEQQHEWRVSDFEARSGTVYGRRLPHGPYERVPSSAHWPRQASAPSYRHRPALGPKLADLVRQNTARLSDADGNISFATEAAAATDNRSPPPPPPLTPEEKREARRRAKAERAAHLAARDQCIREIRERDRAAGIVCISSGHLNWRSRY